jgi:4-hydroxy-2-oxoheptanedioate aldolase
VDKIMANKIKDIWVRGGVAVNVFLTIPSGVATEIMGQAGWDGMTVDMQHGAHDYHSAVECFQAMLRHDVTPMVRVPANEVSIIGRMLDAGAYGVIVPNVGSGEEAARIVSACRYPPDGVRSNGAVRPLIYESPDSYMKRAADDIIVMPMIETPDGMKNFKAIVRTPGVDAIYIGPNDLGLGMGFGAKMERDEPAILDFYKALIAEANDAGVKCGIHVSTVENAKMLIGMGFRLVTFVSEAWHMLQGARTTVTALRPFIDANQKGKFGGGHY